MSLSSQGVYIIVNEAIRRAYVFHGTNMLDSIKRHMSDLKTSEKYKVLYTDIETYGLETFELKVIETYDGTKTDDYLRVRLRHVCDQLETSGYTLYNAYKGIRYRVNTYVGADMNIYVELISSTDKREIVGVFSKVKEADEFHQKLVSSPCCIPLQRTYATNPQTIKWLKNRR